MSIELPKVYEPQEAEARIYEKWEKAGCFRGQRDPKKKPFTIVMPPPNVTGQLHMGHAMDCALQDILIRFKRMVATPPCGSPASTTPASPPRSRWRRSCAPRRA